MKLAIVLAVAACAGTKPKPIVASHAAAPAVPAAHYAALFARGASWRYAVKTTSEMYDPDDPEADHDGMVRDASSDDARCRVAEVRAWSRGVMSRIECDLGDHDPLTGAWAADARGLYRLDDLPASGDPDLTDAELVITAAPVEGTLGDDVNAQFGQSTAVSAQPGGWCVTREAWGGDESYATLCFAKTGVTSGASGWSGGSTHDTTFDLLR